MDAVKHLPKVNLTGSGLKVTPLCIGGGPISNLPDVFGYDVPTERALQTVRSALASPINWIDTAAAYGDGSVERMIGLVLGELGGVPEGYVVATKADRDLKTGDFNGPQVRRSVFASAARLGVDHLELVYLHDPHHVSFEEATAPGGALETLLALRDEHVIEAVGLAGGAVDLLSQYLDVAQFDVLLTHNRYTLLDRSAHGIIDKAKSCGTSVVNAAVFGGGILAKGVAALPKYAYQPAPPPVLDAVTAMEKCCSVRGIPLSAAALQFSTRDPRISSTVVGVSRPERIDETLALYHTPIPDELWEELAQLTPDPHYWLC
jgi:D-threo-aldose 1-dehydrogenase